MNVAAVVARARRVWLRPPEYVGALLVLVGFAATQWFYHARGVRLDWSTLASFDQLIDPILLRERPWQSLLHLHGQPPLYNLLTAFALKLAPNHPAFVLAPVFVACGLYMGLAAYVILLRLRVPVLVAALLVCAMVAAPPFVLYQSWYFYPHLNVTFIVGAGAWLAQSRGRPGREMVIAAAHLVALALTRSLFHPVYFVLVALVVAALAAPGTRRRALVCFALPGLLLLLWCAKNQALFGFFGTSSWGSRNLARAVSPLVGADRVAAEARRGRLSPAAGRDAFEPGDRNVSLFQLQPRTTGVPLLDEVYKRTPSFHSVSYNHWSFPATAQFYAHDLSVLLSTYPVTYLRALARTSVPLFFHPVDEDNFFRFNRVAIPEATRWADALDQGTASRVVLALGLLFSLVALFAPATPRAQRVVLAFAFLTMAWVFVLGVAGELGENSRFRYKALWLSWIVATSGSLAALRQAAAVVAALVTRARLQEPDAAVTMPTMRPGL